LFAVVPSDVGAAYVTVTVLPWPTGDANVNTTVLVPDVVATDETGIVTPPLVTVNALVSAVVVERFSLYVSVIVVPVEVLATDTHVGAVLSTNDPFVTVVVESDTASVPEMS
jgi:cadmium resistance protein CadD (predicted permease)